MDLTENETFKCIKCQSELRSASNNELICARCNFSYPQIAGIPILVDDPPSYIAEAFYLYSHHIEGLEKYIEKINRFFRNNAWRKNLQENLVKAIRYNQNVVRRLTGILLPHVSPSQLVKVRTNPHNDVNRYLKDFEYLRRDWSGLPEGELQLKTIVQSLMEVLEVHVKERDTALVLGAGTGRIATEISHMFLRTLATDLSFSMAFHYHEILRGEFSFYEINTLNIYNNADATRKIDVAFVTFPTDSNTSTDVDENISYFVSDVQKLPLKDESVSCILSVYFTDVLALKLWLPEIKRVLKKDGVFVHFGPLGYPFEDLSERLSAEDIKMIFVKNDFKVLTDAKIQTDHLASSLNISKTVFQNWLFTAAKIGSESGKEISDFSVPFLESAIGFELTGEISSLHEETIACKLIASDREAIYGSAVLLDIMRAIDGKKTVKEIIDTLADTYDLGSKEIKEINNLFKTLLQKSYLKIKQ